MDSLISRQAAIDAFWKIEIEIRPSAIDAVINMLKTLPSAQPEFAKDMYVLNTDCISRQTAIEEIKRCESADSYDFNNGLIRAMNAIADIPSAQPEYDCVLKLFGDCSYGETGCSDCEIKAKIRTALSAQPE